MDLETWRNGIDICIDNVLRLYEDGNLLIENGSFGHACFSFITAFEEMGLAFFIIGNYSTPKPGKFKKFLVHKKKIALANIARLFSTGEPLGNMRNFYNAWVKDMKKNVPIKNWKNSEIIKLAENIQKEENLWYLRIRGIYVSLNNSKTDFLSPNQIKKEQAQILKERLEEVLPYLQTERDVLKKYGSKSNTEIEVVEKMIGINSNIEDIFNVLVEGSIEKLNEFKNISPTLKDIFTNLILGNYPIKHEELELNFDGEFNKDNEITIITIILYEFIKSFRAQFKLLLESGRSKEIIEYWIQQMKKYSPDRGEIIESFLSLLDIFIKEDSKPEDLIKLFKN